MYRIVCCLLIGLLINLTACRRPIWQQQLRGLKSYAKQEFWYELITSNPKAPKPQVGEEVQIEYTLQRGSTVLDHSYDNTFPILVQVPEARYDNFFTKALKLMAEGDSLRLLIPADEIPELLGDFAPLFEEDELVTFTYKMEAIKSEATKQQEIMAEQAYLDSIRKKIPTLIQNFEQKKLEGVQTTASGLSYLLLDEGKGPAAAVGDFVQVHYICFTQDQRIVDDSYTNMVPMSFQIGSQSLIEGWSEGIQLLKEGGKAVLFVPPQLAYGSQGNGDVIPPDTWLTFFIELMDVEKN